MSFVRRATRAPVGWYGRAALCGVVASGAVLAAASLPSCSEERLPPPRPQAGSSAGAGASGGAAPDASVDEAPGPANLCECVAAYGGEAGRCGDCINEHAARGARCEAQLAACDGEPGCRQISLCLNDCGRDKACQAACVFPEDAGAAQRAFQRVLACACVACGARCAYRGTPLECAEPDFGPDGGDGAGGAGGAGGGAGGAGGGAGGAGGAAGATAGAGGAADASTGGTAGAGGASGATAGAGGASGAAAGAGGASGAAAGGGGAAGGSAAVPAEPAAR
ncbi:hypothetical protein [Sorangium sp. So ce513]|uniref:hypothetical protein n=1 Tax=Sorangium sp. So ce513 TaxID=3133315 RepID=UPI003F5F962D